MALFDFLSKPVKPAEDSGFMEWYLDVARSSDVSLDPDDPRHYYDYRAAYKAGAELDENRHMPSEFKHDLHPNRYVVGKDLEIWDSKYGEKATLEDMIMQSFQRKELEEGLWTE